MKRFAYYPVLIVCLALGCDEKESEPLYPPEPHIESASLEFVESKFSHISADTLILKFKFRDGDFDLGLDAIDVDSPYHQLNFFAEKNGNLEPLVSQSLNYDLPLVINPNPGQSGKLVTYNRLKDITQNTPDFSCKEHYYDYVYLQREDESFIDDSYNITDTVSNNGNDIYEILDTFLIEKNKNHYNISVAYLSEQSDGSFDIFDWSSFNCITFDGRFFLLNDMAINFKAEAGPFIIQRLTRQTGLFSYSMASNGFKLLFGGKKIKIRFSIKDRALNQSNIIETNVIEIPTD